MCLLSVGTTSQLALVCPQHQPLWASLPLACPVADPVAPQPHMVPGSGREEQQLLGVNILPCSSSTGEVPPVLACRALCPVPVLRGGPHGRVQHATVHPPGVQGDGCQGECSCRLPSSACLLCLCRAQASEGSMQQLLEELESKVLPCTAGRRGCCPPPAAPLTTSSFLASCGSPGEQLRDPYQHQTLPCLCCILGQAFNTGSPAPGVSVCTI